MTATPNKIYTMKPYFSFTCLWRPIGLLVLFLLALRPPIAAQTGVNTISFTVENISVTGSSPRYLEFDIYARGNNNRTYFDNAVFRLRYDPFVFGPLVEGNGKVSATRGPAFDNDTYKLPQVYDVDWEFDWSNTTHRRNDLLGIALSMDDVNRGLINRTLITTTPQQLLHLKLEIGQYQPTTTLDFLEYDKEPVDFNPAKHGYYTTSPDAIAFDTRVYNRVSYTDATATIDAGPLQTGSVNSDYCASSWMKVLYNQWAPSTRTMYSASSFPVRRAISLPSPG